MILGLIAVLCACLLNRAVGKSTVIADRKEETVTNSGGHGLADFLVTLFLCLS